MVPPSKKRKIEKKEEKEIPLSSVLEWFDTTTKPSSILAREKERKTISDFITNCLHSGNGRSIYICGSPGIGKTLLVTNILEEFKSQQKRSLKIVMLNAMSLQKNQDIYSSILDGLAKKQLSWEKAKQELENLFLKKQKSKRCPIILCIDEVDRLFSNERSIIYDLFEWPYKSSTTLIVIGIANSIDLVEKSLPLLKINKDQSTETMVFPSYSIESLKSIIQQRIQLCNESLHTSLQLFQPAAIELCCRKVSETGDARRLLDICKTVLQQTYNDNLVSNEKVVTIANMSKLLSQFFRPNQQSIISDLPRMVQVLLACLCAMMKEKQEKLESTNQIKTIQITANTLKQVYIQVLKNIIGGTRPSVIEYQQLFDQLINNGICKVVSSSRQKPGDKPILMIMKLEMIISELQEDADLNKILKRGWEFIK